MTELTQKSLEDMLVQLQKEINTSEQVICLSPTLMIIPAPVKQWMKERGITIDELRQMITECKNDIS